MNMYEILITGKWFDEWEDVIVQVLIPENGFVTWDLSSGPIPAEIPVYIFFGSYMINGTMVDCTKKNMIIGPKICIFGTAHSFGKEVVETGLDPISTSIGDIHISKPSH